MAAVLKRKESQQAVRPTKGTREPGHERERRGRVFVSKDKQESKKDIPIKEPGL